MNKKDRIVKWTIISIFVALYAMVSIISTIHVIDFFRLSNPNWLAVTLAIAFEVGAAASLGAIVILDKTSRWLIWSLFILITGMQIMGNMYYAYTHLENFQGWIELFGLNEEEPIFQKRMLSIVSGAILPIVALGFIKSLVDYIRPSNEVEDTKVDKGIPVSHIWEKVNELREEGKLPTPTAEDLEDEPTALANSGYRERAEERYVEDEDEKEEIVEDTPQITMEFAEDEDEEEIPEPNEALKEAAKRYTTERKIAKAISENPELKEKLSEEIKRLEEKDKYTKAEESPIANINTERRTFGGM